MDQQVPDSASLADQARPQALTQAARAPNIRRAPERADLQVPEALQRPVHDPDLAHAPDLERGQVLPEHAQAHLRPVKLRARSAPVPAAADAASNSIRKPKKAR